MVARLATDASFLKSTAQAAEYLFVDEFQDLNRCQYELVRILARTSSVFAIGDPDQAIYGFRGSSPEFFRRFIAESGAETLYLVRNYRSARNILAAAAAVIANNHVPAAEPWAELIPENSEPGGIELHQAASPQAEAEYIVQRIEELMGGISHFSIDSGRGGESESAGAAGFRDFAILYRLTQQAESLREALERRGIPFQMVNVRPFFMHMDIRPLYYWIRAAADAEPGGVETGVYLQLLRTFPGIGEHTLALLENRLPLGGCPDFFTMTAVINLPKAARERIEEVQQQLAVFRKETSVQGISGSAGGIMEFLRINAKTADANRFLELAGLFGTDLQGFAAYLRKNETATVYDARAEAVALMTMHAAKGLEFPFVFITGMEEGVFPCELDLGGKDDGPASVQEERRLFYVGMTRAEKRLILTSAATRQIFGSFSNRPVSPFVAEIPPALCEQRETRKLKKKKTAAKQMKLF